MKYRTTALIAAMLCTSAAALGQDLKVGDRAPKLSVDEWVKGAEFESFQKGKVYIVEFWATWCAPCIRSIPHLSEIQTEHADDGVIVLGVAGSERKGRDHLFEWVEEDDNGKKIAYNVAYDADRSMFETWMTAAGKGGIPTAFLIDRDGKIAYIGHPSRLDKPLKKVLAKGGTYAGADNEDRPFELMLGDKAPKLAIGEWVKGKPITGFENGRVYVVEFWATWCGPCIAGMPHLSDIQKEYADKGVRIIGVNIWDDPAKVEPFMEDRDDRPSGNELMQYTVAIEKKYDGEDPKKTGAMAKTWMNAAGKRGIPTAFIIDQKGRVAWMGHPMGMDEPLEAIVNGEWNIEAEVKKQDKAQKAQKQIDQYFELFKAGEYDEAYAIGRTLVAGGLADNADYLNRLAWGIVDPDNMPAKQDLELALKAALRASELTDNEDAAILDTVAKVYFDKRDLKKAIKYQRQAVKYAGDDQRQLDDLSDRLNWYEKEAKKGGG
ncbi:MAG: redoxin family protein [Planctomycetes bacterium]|nr:redoxin family protein [Planctomycetota bacterium]